MPLFPNLGGWSEWVRIVPLRQFPTSAVGPLHSHCLAKRQSERRSLWAVWRPIEVPTTHGKQRLLPPLTASNYKTCKGQDCFRNSFLRSSTTRSTFARLLRLWAHVDIPSAGTTRDLMLARCRYGASRKPGGRLTWRWQNSRAECAPFAPRAPRLPHATVQTCSARALFLSLYSCGRPRVARYRGVRHHTRTSRNKQQFLAFAFIQVRSCVSFSSSVVRGIGSWNLACSVNASSYIRLFLRVCRESPFSPPLCASELHTSIPP